MEINKHEYVDASCLTLKLWLNKDNEVTPKGIILIYDQ